MPDFAYIARDLRGQKVSGSLTAASERDVISLLSTKSLFPVEVSAATPQTGIRFSRGVSGQLMATTYGQLSSLLRSGVPLLRSLNILREQTSNRTLKEVLGEVHDRVEEGATLGDAVGRFPNVFSEMAINMVRAGGEGGFLEDALDRVAQFTEQQQDLKSRTIGALIYPVILATFGTIIVAILITFFVPMFGEIFDQLRERGELPWATDLLLGLSSLVRSLWGLLFACVLIGVGVFIRIQLGTERGKRIRDVLVLKIPMAGGIFLSLAVARFCRVLGTLLHNGVPILRSLEISREAAGNRVLSEAIAKASENISAGASLAAPLAASGHFPTTVVEMISVAEESNTLNTVLINIAEGLEVRTARRLDIMVRMLEPLMLIVMAGVVLFVVLALLMPMIKMMQLV